MAINRRTGKRALEKNIKSLTRQLFDAKRTGDADGARELAAELEKAKDALDYCMEDIDCMNTMAAQRG